MHATPTRGEPVMLSTITRTGDSSSYSRSDSDNSSPSSGGSSSNFAFGDTEIESVAALGRFACTKCKTLLTKRSVKQHLLDKHHSKELGERNSRKLRPFLRAHTCKPNKKIVESLLKCAKDRTAHQVVRGIPIHTGKRCVHLDCGFLTTSTNSVHARDHNCSSHQPQWEQVSLYVIRALASDQQHSHALISVDVDSNTSVTNDDSTGGGHDGVKFEGDTSDDDSDAELEVGPSDPHEQAVLTGGRLGPLLTNINNLFSIDRRVFLSRFADTGKHLHKGTCVA